MQGEKKKESRPQEQTTLLMSQTQNASRNEKK